MRSDCIAQLRVDPAVRQQLAYAPMYGQPQQQPQPQQKQQQYGYPLQPQMMYPPHQQMMYPPGQQQPMMHPMPHQQQQQQQMMMYPPLQQQQMMMYPPQHQQQQQHYPPQYQGIPATAVTAPMVVSGVSKEPSAAVPNVAYATIPSQTMEKGGVELAHVNVSPGN